jgi:adenylate cyclase
MMQEGYRRKLTVILNADVEGYSRLMREDEEATIRTLTTYRGAMASLVQQYQGRVVDSPGDNLLAEFASVVDAVQCAVEIQCELAERNDEIFASVRWSFVLVSILEALSRRETEFTEMVSISRLVWKTYRN